MGLFPNAGWRHRYLDYKPTFADVWQVRPCEILGCDNHPGWRAAFVGGEVPPLFPPPTHTAPTHKSLPALSPNALTSRPTTPSSTDQVPHSLPAAANHASVAFRLLSSSLPDNVVV